MKFKVDENLPAEIAELLIRSGHDAKTVNEEQLKGIDDPNLIKICKRENRAIITMDTDFSDINTYPPEDYDGIIVLRLGSQSKNHVLKIFKHLILTINIEPLEKHLWIVEDSFIRIRG